MFVDHVRGAECWHWTVSICVKVCASSLLALALACVPNSPRSSSSVAPTRARKIIEFGWDLPTPDVLNTRVAKVESHPFDGLVVKLHVGPAIFASRPYPATALLQDLVDLRSFRSSSLTENFLLVWATREPNWDWFSDSDWAAAEQNIRSFAQLARAGGLRGIVLDTEVYGPAPWDYRQQPHYAARSFSLYEQQLRARGAQFMRALLSELPDATVLLTWGPASLALYPTPPGKLTGGSEYLESNAYGLLLAFVDGAEEELRGKAQIVDGNEQSYYYLSQHHFAESDSLRAASIAHCASGGAGSCNSPVRLGQAVYVDWLVAPAGSSRFFGFYMPSTSARLKLLEQNVYLALRSSDEYVWIYSERMNWWTGELPPGVAQAVQRAKRDFLTGTAPEPDVAEPVRVAQKLYSARVTIEGKIMAGASGVQGIVMQGLESACTPTDYSGSFNCIVPGDWSGRLLPTHAGAIFSPPERTFRNVRTNQREQDFSMQ